MDEITKFDDFISKLYPEKSCISLITNYLVKVETKLRENSDFIDAEFFTGGPFKRETMMKNKYEAELVCAVHRKAINFNEFSDKVFDLIKMHYPKARRFGQNKVSLRFNDENLETPIRIDIMPSYRANSPKQMKDVKRPQYYRGYSSKVHSIYLSHQKTRIPNLISCILLLKHWAKKYYVPLFPIHLELITINALSKVEKFSWYDYLISAFTTFIQMTEGETIYPVNWEKKYKLDEISAVKSEKNGVLVVDPANPANNIAGMLSVEDISKIKEESLKALEFTQNRAWDNFFNDSKYNE